MVDDLTRKGVEEPYRLFTSRAEYRLLLGVDTVLPRLLPHGRRLGLIDEGEFDEAMRGEERLRRSEDALRRRAFNPSAETRSYGCAKLGIDFETPVTAFKLLQRNDLTVDSTRRRGTRGIRRSVSRAGQLPREPRSIRGLHSTRARASGAHEALRVEADTRWIPLRVDSRAFARGRREVRAPQARDRRRGVADSGRYPGCRRDNLGACRPSRGASRRSLLRPSRRFLRAALPGSGVRLPHSAASDLAKYLSELDRGGARINLTGNLSAGELVDHAIESILAQSLIAHGERVIDVGSGAGFPGLPLAIVRPDLT